MASQGAPCNMHGLEKLICTPSHDKVGVLKVSSKLGKYFLSYASDKKRTEIRKIKKKEKERFYVSTFQFFFRKCKRSRKRTGQRSWLESWLIITMVWGDDNDILISKIGICLLIKCVRYRPDGFSALWKRKVSKQKRWYCVYAYHLKTRCYLRVERKQIKVIRGELRDMNALLWPSFSLRSLHILYRINYDVIGKVTWQWHWIFAGIKEWSRTTTIPIFTITSYTLQKI